MHKHNGNVLTLWHRLRAPFPLPSQVSGHQCTEYWEIVDVDKAGCVKCGKTHVCDNNTCPMATSDGSSVCTITGYCIRGKVFADNNTMSTCKDVQPFDDICVVPSCKNNEAPGEQDNKGPKKHKLHDRFRQRGRMKNTTKTTCTENKLNSLDNIRTHLASIISTPRLRYWQTYKIAKSQNMKRSLFTAICKAAKMKIHATNTPINVIDLITLLANKLPHAFKESKTRLHCEESVNRTLEKCTAQITRLLRILLTHSDRTFPPYKMRSISIGLVYLMRTGLFIHGTIILEAIPELHNILPPESALEELTGLKPKLVTETENIVKHIIRTLPMSTFAGMHQ